MIIVLTFCLHQQKQERIARGETSNLNVSRTDAWVEAHKKKDGTAVNKKAKKIIVSKLVSNLL